MKKSLIAAAALIALGGCAENFSARVSRFQALPPATGQSFVVQAADQRLQGGLEFGQYARLVTTELVRQGYQPAADPARADLVVKLAYSVDNGREKIISYPGYSGFGGFGRFGGLGGFGRFGGFYGRSSFIYGFNDPFLYGGFGGFGGYSDVRSYTVFNSALELQIERTDNGQRVFEGTARAQSRDDNLTYLVPNLIEAMFTGFPGNSGQTLNITIAPEKKKS